jgi:hypothetical protein
MIRFPHASKSTPASGATKATLIKEPRLKIIHQRDVIPNRAESPVRNLLFVLTPADRALLPAAFDVDLDFDRAQIAEKLTNACGTVEERRFSAA